MTGLARFRKDMRASKTVKIDVFDSPQKPNKPPCFTFLQPCEAEVIVSNLDLGNTKTVHFVEIQRKNTPNVNFLHL